MQGLNYPHIASQLLDAPLLIHPRKLDNILAAVGPRIAGLADWSMVIEADQVSHRRDANYVVADGVAIIPVIGSLVHRGSEINYSGMTAYQALDRNLTLAANDSSVNSILLDIDSPGGQVSGAFQLAERIRQISSNKKIVAVASDLAASAGYLLASAATEVVVTKTGSLGSIGVVTAHIDRSQEMAQIGRAVTLIYAGSSKVDGNPYAPLPDSVKADLQAEIDKIYQMFTAHVGQMRRIGQQAAIDTQAKMFMGADAVSAGLADRVGTLESEFARLKAANPSRGAGSRRFATRQAGKIMSDSQKEGGEQQAGGVNPQTAVMELTTAEIEKIRAEAFAEGAGAERARIMQITAYAKELGIGAAITDRMITGGYTPEMARDLMTGIKEATTHQTHINTSHAAGMVDDNKQANHAVIDTAAIYAARNGVRQ